MEKGSSPQMTKTEETAPLSVKTSNNVPPPITCPSTVIGNYGDDGCWYPDSPPLTPTSDWMTFPVPVMVNSSTNETKMCIGTPDVQPTMPLYPTQQVITVPMSHEHSPTVGQYMAPPPNMFFIQPPLVFPPTWLPWNPGYHMNYPWSATNLVPPSSMVAPKGTGLEIQPCFEGDGGTQNYVNTGTQISKLYETFKGTEFPTTRPTLLTVKPSKYSVGLEKIWRKHFVLVFNNFPDAWLFSRTEEALPSWDVFLDNAKVRFCCKNCNHGWTSMHGSVLFYYRKTFCGEVKFMLTGQKCDSCDDPEFQSPAWYPEEAEKVMNNLSNAIASRIYCIPTEPKSRDRRHGKPSRQHNSDGCQSCQLGVCHVGRKLTPEVALNNKDEAVLS